MGKIWSDTRWLGLILLMAPSWACGSGQLAGGAKPDGSGRVEVDSDAQSDACAAAACEGGASETTSNSAVVGPSGGIVSLSGGPSIEIPPGALATPTMITVSAVTSSPPKGALTQVFSFGPDGMVFAVPTTIKLAVPKETTRAVIFWTRADGSSQFEALPSTTLDGTVSALVSHFSSGFGADDGEPPCVSAVHDNAAFCSSLVIERSNCQMACKHNPKDAMCQLACFAANALIARECATKGCSAALGLTCCDGQCVDTGGDRMNCAGCGKRCGGSAAGDVLLYKCSDFKCACDDSPCEPGFERDPDTCACSCPDSQCPPGEGQDPTTCACEACAPSGSACQGKCVSCPPGQAPDADTCKCACPGVSCPAGQHQDPDTCGCVPDAPKPPPCLGPVCMRTPMGGQGLTVGDPHLRTFDGLKYDCQAVGELTLVRDPADELEIQTRTAPWGSSLNLAANIAVAARVGANTVAFYMDGSSTLNGASASFAADKTALPTGGEVHVSGSLRTLVWPDGSQMRAQLYETHIDLEVFVNAARAGRLRGLLGNFDAVAAGDLVTRAGVAMDANPSFEDFYGKYVESWRIHQQDSLFTYGAGETTETKTDRAFPHTGATSADLTAAQRAAALAACAAAGVKDPQWLDSCILDVGRTGDTSFAAGLATAAGARMTVDLQPSTCPAAGSRVILGLAPTDPERLVSLQWIASSGNSTPNLVAEGGGLTCQDPTEFFGQSYGAPEGTGPVPVVAGHLASIASCGLEIDVVGGPIDCAGAAQLPVSTTYLAYADARASQLRIARTFGFGPTTPLFASTGLRPYVPRLALASFPAVIYPNQAGTAVSTVGASACGGDCFVATGPTWNGRWFADVSPATGYAVIVLRDPAMTSPVDLTINNDGSSGSNLASFILLQPAAGWTTPITEVEYLCFADLASWPQAQRDAAQLPAGCRP